MSPLANACTLHTDAPCARTRRLRLLSSNCRLCRFRRPPHADADRYLYPHPSAHASTFCHTHPDSDCYSDTCADTNAHANTFCHSYTYADPDAYSKSHRYTGS